MCRKSLVSILVMVMVMVMVMVSATVIMAEEDEAGGSYMDEAMISSLFSTKFDGSEETEEEDEDPWPMYYGEYFDEANEAINRHLVEETREYLEPGDETVFHRLIVSVFTDEDGTIYMLGYFVIMNFDAKGTDLVMKNGAGNTELLTLTLNEEGTHDVTEFVVAEDGEGYAKSIEPMCEAMEITTDEFYDAFISEDMDYGDDLYEFLLDHPEYERIEFQGELRTLEELDEILIDLFIEFLDALIAKGE